MIKIKNVFLLVVLLAVPLLAQENDILDKERFNFLMDSLLTEKSSLLLEKESLLNAIDSMQNLLAEYEERCKSARSDQLIRKYGNKIGKRIAQGQVWKGMTVKMLEDSWGKPDKITTNKEKWGTFAQWYYGDITYFFRDGEMIDWEEKK